MYTQRGHKLRFFVIARARSARSNLNFASTEIASLPSAARNPGTARQGKCDNAVQKRRLCPRPV